MEDKIPDIPSIAINTIVNAEINEAKNEILSITNLATTSLTAVENKIANVCNLVKKT